MAETTASLFLSTEEGEGPSVNDPQGNIFDRMVEVSLEGLSLAGDIDGTTSSEHAVCDADKQGGHLIMACISPYGRNLIVHRNARVWRLSR